MTPWRCALQDLGFGEPDRIAERIAGWSDGRIRALRSKPRATHSRACCPPCSSVSPRAPEPDQALNRWERVLAACPSAINLFNLLDPAARAARSAGAHPRAGTDAGRRARAPAGTARHADRSSRARSAGQRRRDRRADERRRRPATTTSTGSTASAASPANCTSRSVCRRSPRCTIRWRSALRSRARPRPRCAAAQAAAVAEFEAVHGACRGANWWCSGSGAWAAGR